MKKEVKASELKPGQVVRVEFGDYGNYIKFRLEKIEDSGKYIYAVGATETAPKKRQELIFSHNECVEVLSDE